MTDQPDPILTIQLRSRGVLPSTINYGSVSKCNSTHKFMFKRRCNRHHAYRTKAAVVRRPDTLMCPACHPDGCKIFRVCGLLRPVGKDEARLWRILDSLFPGDVWSVQDMVRGWRGRVDACMYFPWKTWVAIQVDGITHGKRFMPGRGHQLEVDAKFNDVAMTTGMSVVRLDTDHTDSAWGEALQRARDACRDHASPPQVFHS